MTSNYIPVELQRQVRADAGRRCGYCLSPEVLLGAVLEFEHLTPLATGGETTRENLWLACRRCNQFKADRTAGSDPETGETFPLFNPRTQNWFEHFSWQPNGVLISGLTPIGRTTVAALRLNHPTIVETRRFWVQVGWWPPTD